MTITEGVEFVKTTGSLGVLVVLVYWMMGYQRDISNNTRMQIESLTTAMTNQIKSIMDAHSAQVVDMNARHERQIESVHVNYEKKLSIIADSYGKSIDQMVSLLKDSQNSAQELSKQSVSAITKNQGK